MTWLSEHIVGIGWTCLAWALLIAVWGGIAYRRWQHRERLDAAETEVVMHSLKTDHSHLHEGDAL